MRLSVTHTTTYRYGDAASLCHTEARLAPRTLATQTLLEHELIITPRPDLTISRRDYFGNAVAYFSITRPHRALTVTARSLVERIAAAPIELAATPPWESVAAEFAPGGAAAARDDGEFVFAPPDQPPSRACAEYAAASFTPGRPILVAARDLCARIHRDFRYDPSATAVNTTVDEAMRLRAGVCQDFAQVMIACVRAIGLPARYVSGYLRSGRFSIGAEASHAWAAVFAPGAGWIDFDPTNDVMPSDRHVTVAWGRGYADVAPVKGVALGGGDQAISVAVEVTPARE